MMIDDCDNRDGDRRQRQRDTEDDKPQPQATLLSPEKYLPASPPDTLAA